MAMSSAQIAAFEAASGGTVVGHHLLWVGALFSVLFIWAAWSLVVLYKGFVGKNVSPKEFMGGLIRLMLIILIGGFVFLR
jgi:integrating conjugative element protein (TIGR03758 family)